MNHIRMLPPARETDWAYRLTVESEAILSRAGAGHYLQSARAMANGLETVHAAENKLCSAMRSRLPRWFSSSLIPRVERVVQRSGENLRAELYKVFVEELEAAVDRERARERQGG